MDEHYSSFNFYRGIDAILAQLRETNTFIQRHKPWELKSVSLESNDSKWLDCILHVALVTLQVTGILLQPITPRLCDKLLHRLSVSKSERNFDELRSFLKQNETLKERALGPNLGVFFSRIK